VTKLTEVLRLAVRGRPTGTQPRVYAEWTLVAFSVLCHPDQRTAGWTASGSRAWVHDGLDGFE